MAGLLIWVFTVDIQFTLCCETCDVSTVVGMTLHNVCIISMYALEKAAFFIIKHYF